MLPDQAKMMFVVTIFLLLLPSTSSILYQPPRYLNHQQYSQDKRLNNYKNVWITRDISAKAAADYMNNEKHQRYPMEKKLPTIKHLLSTNIENNDLRKTVRRKTR
ncbi:unnamed protein product [Didymodactylos carnosus]|uniref:Uncharacterized protein n=1 Tax=Didymodactylos carnosus TaxID=1234261 RepID=A0A813NWB1_9BILA|nr:unnamed protein product [Didymodactylos carnosus]CAF0964021.1 unnamed protein product [Didymodactylos carnosus]CAF3524239.1 unnamed protein product [Didymodactylos carnosus]CAF3736035.1 unnamed protein product [Didymodactylos carnosus]